MEINIGLKEEDRKKLAEELCKVLAESYILYIKTHAFHWNVEGPMFNTLHIMFEEQYNELFEAVDEIAERIRALGYPAPGSYKSFSKLSSIKESEDQLLAKQMIQELLEGQETLIRTLRNLINLSNKAGDESTSDLATTRMKQHEKVAWMLRSLLQH
ncbi:MAG: DNA starvation/stationary phase protection protein [Bdellovibrionales bacterium]|nr:DNA starvation/stationary phase protection protein [Bdellovibrionales bacterium]